MFRGMSLLASIAALAIAATLIMSWSSLWHHQQHGQQVQQWRMALLQLQQAQRNFFRNQQRFANSQQELVDSGLLPQVLAFAKTSAWRFEAQQHSLIMQADVTLAEPSLLLGQGMGYVWQPPTLTLKVVGYVTR